MLTSRGSCATAAPSAAQMTRAAPTNGSIRARSITGRDPANSTVNAPDAAMYPSIG